MKPPKAVTLALALSVTAALARYAAANAPPSTYNAISTTAVIAKPSVIDSGLFDLNLTDCPSHTAGYIFTPTDFYCPIVRVTDPNTDPNHVGKSYYGPNSWMQIGWNVNSSRFYIQNGGGNYFVYNFNINTMACTQIAGAYGAYNGLTDWDTNNENYCYGKSGTKLIKWDFSQTPPTNTTVVDVASVITGVTEVYESHISDGTGHGGSKPIKIIAVTGGNGSQGTDYYVLWYNTSTLTGYFYNTMTGIVTDTSGNQVASGLPSNFHIHQASVTRDGQYVWIQEAETNTSSPYVWDTTANTVTALGGWGVLSRPGGHQVLGWGEVLNADYASTPKGYWWYRQMDTLTHIQNPANLVANVPTSMASYDDHMCWNSAQNGGVSTDWLPAFTGTIQDTGTYNQNPNYWGDEILGIATADRSGAGANTVWRFAHHRSTITAHPEPGIHVAGQTYDDYYANAWPNVSQDGQWIMFVSNWEETLGTIQGGTVGGSPWYYYRDDVFIVKLTQSAH